MVPTMRPPLLTLVITALSSIGSIASSSFVAPRTAQHCRRHSRLCNYAQEQRHVGSGPKEHRGDDDAADARAEDESESVATDGGRRRFVLSRLVPLSTLPLFLPRDDVDNVASASEIVGLLPPPSTSTENIAAPVVVERIDAEKTVAVARRSPPNSNNRVFCADSAEESRIAIFERVAPSVVYIDTFSEKRDVFSTNVMEVPVGSGSGFLWDDAGHVVTNFHVVQSAKSAQVAILTSSSSSSGTGGGGASSSSPSSSMIARPAYTSARPGALGSGGSNTAVDGFTRTVYRAKVVGVDPTKDIAVLKVDDVPVRDLRPIEVGTSTGLRVGQGSLAIGNPFGLDHTLTTGVISGIGREVKSPIGRPISNVIQTDAAINPGNSGGPLLDSSGKMIGMATAIYSPSGASAGVGFAIPVDTVKSIVTMLIQNGQIVRPLLGVSILDSKQARQALGITKGILILEVKPGTPASQAGLRGLRRTDSGVIEIGDIIIAIEGDPIEKEGDLFRAIETFEPGDVVKVTVNRPEIEVDDDGSPRIKLKELTLEVKLIASDDSTFLKR